MSHGQTSYLMAYIALPCINDYGCDVIIHIVSSSSHSLG